MTKRRLGVLIQGAGWVSGEHIKAFKNNPNTEVVAISSRRMESCQQRAKDAGLENVAFYTDYEKALAHEGVDIVSVCTPQQHHAANTIAAAEAGKHIVIEKAIANSLEELNAMRAAVNKAGVKTVVSFVLRWNPLFQTAKALIADDTLGDIFYTEADYEHDISSWWSGFEEGRQKQYGVSAMLVGGCHAVDAARFFAAKGRDEAATPVEVFAYSGGCRKGKEIEYDYFSNTFRKAPPLEYDDLEVLLVKYSNGAMSKVSVNFGCVMPYTFPIEIFGSKGTIRDNKLWSHKYPGQRDWITIPTVMPESADVKHHPFQSEIDHLVQSILEDKDAHCNLADASLSQEITFAALRCYETKQPVQIPMI